MKIGVVQSGSLGGTYGEKYNDAFWKRLWKENLADRLGPEDATGLAGFRAAS